MTGKTSILEFTSTKRSLSGWGLALVLVLAAAVPQQAEAQGRPFFPDEQAIQTASTPFVFTGTAEFEIGDGIVAAGSFVVPAGMVLVLDGASTTLTDNTHVAEMAVSLRFAISLPGNVSTGIATDLKPASIAIQGSPAETLVATAATFVLPPMHLPAGTSVTVSVLRSFNLSNIDSDVLVAGHLVPAVEP